MNHYCYVQSSTPTEIKCRIAEDYIRSARNQELIVFASTFEEATFATNVNRDFTFLDASALPTITAVTPDFSLSTSDKYRLIISGTDITDSSTETVDVFVGGIKQTTTSVSANQVEVQIDELPSGVDQSLKVYFGVGLPNDMHLFNTVTFEPKLIELT